MPFWRYWVRLFMARYGVVVPIMDRSMGRRSFASLFLGSHALGYLVLIGIVQIACIVFGQGSFAVSQAGEDGSFYVQIASNLADGHGVIFDDLSSTTGVHWGWLFVLAGIFKAIPTHDPIQLFRVAGVVYFLCLCASAAVIYRFTPIGALFMVAYLANRGHWYMETHLVLLTLAMAIRWPSKITGFLLTAARTDMVLFALFSRRWDLAAGAAIGFVWVCIVNTVVDGNPISVSAQIKSAGWNELGTIVHTIGALGKYYFPVLPVMVLLSLWEIDRWFIAALGLLAVHILHNSATEGWYLAPLFLTSLLCSSRVFNRLQRELWPSRRLVGV